MRWWLPDPADHEESAARQTMLRKIDAWWQAFAKEAPRIDAHFRGKSSMDIPGFIRRSLQSIDDRIMWEFGPGRRGGHRLVITPESEHSLRPFIDVLLQRAPSLPGWEFYPYRLPEDRDSAEGMVQGRTGIDLQDVTIHASEGEYSQIDVEFVFPQGIQPEQANQAAFVATECLLGEELLDHWIGLIEGRVGTPTPDAVSPENLKAVVDGKIEAIRAALPDRPYREWLEQRQGEPLGTVLKMEPEKRSSDYPKRSDLFVATTTYLPCWNATQVRGFHSGRFSRHGEVFAYLKTDGRSGFEGETWKDKSELEDDLDARLRETETGMVIGGGMGLTYSYVDFALIDVPKAIQVIRKALQAGNLHRRSWVLFFDQDFAHEWAGIWPDTPPPPFE